MSERWWITTQFFHLGGVKVLGPFETQELAMQVRSYMERAEKHERYYIDQEVDGV